MVYRGSPEEWDWDGSFGSETNPKPGGEQSKWIKENAQSGGGRNEEYYGKIEDDNRYGNIDCEFPVQGSKLFYPELHRWYFLYIHKRICSKVPILLYFVGPKRPTGNS